MNWKHEKWRKLYLREVGTFAGLPLITRSIASYMLKLCDDDGVIAIRPGEELWRAVCARTGAATSERKIVKRACSELLSDGFLSPVEGGVMVKNFGHAQGLGRATVGLRSGLGKPTVDLGSSLGQATVGLQSDLGRVTGEAKPAKEAENQPLVLIRKEEIRGEKKAVDRASTVRHPFGMVEAKDAINAARVKAGLAAVIHYSQQEDTSLAKYVTLVESKPNPAEHVEKAHAAWLAKADDWERRRGLKIWDWLKSPDAALVAAKSAAAVEAKRREAAKDPPPTPVPMPWLQEKP